jgi:hypothetical protein
MACTVITMGDGTTAIVCGRGRRSRPCSVPGCRNPSARLCDYPIGPLQFGREPKTCDAPVCTAHAVKVGPNADHCPPHAKLAATKGNTDR